MEAKIVSEILKWLKENGGDGYKVWGNNVQRAGEPDIDGVYPKTSGGYHHLKIEVKTKKGKPTPLQLYRIAQYKKYGYVSGVVTSVDELKELIAQHEN